jgi:gamma-glutamyl:cysteine ligase YbdK (ATP-grasp superfamily)
MVMPNYSLFSVLGIEIEYMLVDKDSLDVSPKSDIILKQLAGGHQVNSFELGDIEISNELVMHVIELKNNGPRPPEEPIASHFYQAIQTLQPLLEKHHLQFLPTGAHPWMDPLQETIRWPHDNQSIYQQYDTIFNCEGHGWANLQSMHINLPFANDEEFAALHSLIRLLLPLLPALSASTPIIGQKLTGYQDTRLVYYENNQRKIPSISGDIIPEFVTSEAHYQETILAPMYRDISPFDPKGLLQYEWLNSRGAIAKFDYKALEIRVVDTQECVQSDIAIARAVFAILKYWHEQSDHHLQHPYPSPDLKAIYDESLKTGLATRLDHAALFRQWQLPKKSMNIRDIWSFLIERVSHQLDNASQRSLEHILHHGNLSERIVRACRGDYTRPQLQQIYQQLATCLLTNQLFRP